MATSGSINFTQTRNELIADVLQTLGVIGAGETPSTNDYTFCSNMLNKMIKGWEATGSKIWTSAEAVVALRNGVNTYSLGTSGDRAGKDAIETTLSAAASSSATSLTVTSTTGMTAADFIGIELDDNTRQWTTIFSVDSATTLTITTGLTSAAASGNTIITYTTLLERPLDIQSIRYKYASGIERKIRKMGREEFMALPQKTTENASTGFFYTPQLDSGKLYLWPTPTDCGDRLRISYSRSINDMDSGSDNFDCPQEWLECIHFNLCVRVAPAYGKVLSKVNPDIIALANNTLEELKQWDVEGGSLKIVPNYRWDN